MEKWEGVGLELFFIVGSSQPTLQLCLSDALPCYWLVATVNRWNSLKTVDVRCMKENAPSPLEVRGRQVNFSFYDGSVTQPTPQLCRTDSNLCHCLVAPVNRWNAVASNDATLRALDAARDDDRCGLGCWILKFFGFLRLFAFVFSELLHLT